jgi:GntR family transcriptional repressor for pyruvate dehydrogenase complex
MLLRDIEAGVFSVGVRLPPERELTSRYSAGRNTVREAVQRLVALGVLEVRAGRGTTVRKPDARAAIAKSMTTTDRFDEVAMRDLVEFRLLLEASAAGLAAERATDKDHSELRRALAQYQDAVRRAEDVYASDVAFHRSIAKASHNDIYVEVIDRTSQLILNSMRAADRTEGDLLKAAAEHAAVAHHILIGDGPAAEEAMRKHLLASNARRLGVAPDTT